MSILARCLALALTSSLALANPVLPQNAKPHSALPDVTVPEALGVNIHFTDAQKGEMEMLAQGGFRIVRMDFAWSSIEKVKGEYDFAAYERLLRDLEAHKIKPLFILDYDNPFYDDGLSPHTETGRQAFAKWAAASVVHFKGHHILWEMWNEPNGFWKPKKDTQAYIQLALATASAIRQVAPQECQIGPGLAGMDSDYLEACFQAGLLDYWDGVSVHPYRRADLETVADEYRRLRLQIERYKPRGKTIPILSGEWGYSSTWVGDDQQGKYLPRQWMTNLMNQIPVSIWYDWHDDGTDPKNQENNFGTTRNAYSPEKTPVYEPKPSYTAARAFSQFFDGFRFNKRLALAAPNEYLLLFSKGNEVKVAAWTTGAAHEITIPATQGTFKISDYLGKVQPDGIASKTGLKLKISDAPLYLAPTQTNEVLRQAALWPTQPLENLVMAPALISPDTNGPKVSIKRNSTPTALRTTLRAGTFDLVQVTQAVVANPLTLVAEPALGNALLVQVENPNGLPVTGTVTLNNSPAQTVSFVSGERKKTLTFPQPKPDAKGSWEANLVFKAPGKDDNFQSTLRFTSDRVLASLTPETLANSLAASPDGSPEIESEQTLAVAQAAEPASPDGGTVIKFKYRFAPGWKFVNIQPRTPALAKIEGRPKRLGMWLYGDNSGNLARMRFSDSSGQTLQADGLLIDWKGWRFVSFPLDNVRGYWGGAADGLIHGAIKTESLLLIDSTQEKGSQGEIYFASPTWIY